MLKSRRGRKNNNEELFRILKAYFAKAIEAQDAEDKKKAVEARTEGCEAGPSTSKASTEDKPEEEKHGSVGCDKNDAKRKTDEKMEDEEMMDEAAPAKKNKSED
ncbi:hypothetical protein L596_017348 [Steinernema carpocapsae]|uniref:Uncharacterized protein n=1 Tax=Steinernema carpocapsae TaxID=34508 RepID=A0A4U5N1L3_STECR|nr:hypothetical protein L596_017348 [Steinernema carpocapsae]